MTAREKIDAALAYLKVRHVRASTAAPPIWRFFWLVGLTLPPPHFMNFASIVLVTGPPFGLAIAGILLISSLYLGQAVDGSALLLGVGSGLFFGLGLAAYYRWSARRLGVPLWPDFAPDEPCDDTW